MKNDVLLKKISYLLSFKINDYNDNKYVPLLEKVFYEFIVLMEVNYNYAVGKNAYYNLLLSKLNQHIKSIMITDGKSYYHPLGFLELSINFLDSYNLYDDKEKNLLLKEKILKTDYFYHLLLAIKTSKNHIGLISYKNIEKDQYGFDIGTDIFDNDKFSILEKSITYSQALTLVDNNYNFRKDYSIIYPDGTKHKYFTYLHSKHIQNLEIINVINILEIIIGKKTLIDKEINDYNQYIDEFNNKYNHLIDDIAFDKSNNKRIQTAWNYILDLIYMISNNTGYKKLEYMKIMNLFLLRLYEDKINNIDKSNIQKEDINSLLDEIRKIEENILYNDSNQLNKQMNHIILLNDIKKKINNSLNDSNVSIYKKREYSVESNDKLNRINLDSSIKPIKINNTYITIDIKDILKLEDRYLVKFDTNTFNFDDMKELKYRNIYLLIDNIKYLYSSLDLEVMSRENDIVRTLIGSRIYNVDIMKIIIEDRCGFLGEFIYSSGDSKCTIYKNNRMVEYLRSNR